MRRLGRAGADEQVARRATSALLAVAAFAFVTSGHPARAADGYPARPIRIVCPFPPGGGADSVARVLGQRLSQQLGKPVVVDNRPGAAGAIGAGIVAAAASDGHTLLLGSSSVLAATPALKGRTYRQVAAELAPVTLVSRISYVLVVHPSIPVKSVAEFIRHAGSAPGRIDYSSSGVGSASHLAMELFRSMARIELTHVPFKGSSPAAVALIGGEVKAGFNNLVPAAPHVKSGRLRALGVSGPSRWSGLPDVATIADSGLPGYEALQWYGVLLPAGTPGALIERLHREIGVALGLADVRGHLANEGGEVVGSAPREFAAFMETEIGKWTRVVKSANIRAD